MHVPPLSPLLALSLVAGLTAQNWIQNPGNGHLYAVTAPMTWDAAQSYATTVGSHLVTIRDAPEQSWIVQQFAANNLGGLWIGLSDFGHNGVWAWSNGEAASYSNWATGQPSNTGGVEHWVALQPGSGRWDDAQNFPRPAVIEALPRWRWSTPYSAPVSFAGACGTFDALRGVGVVVGGPSNMQTGEWDGQVWHINASFPGRTLSQIVFDGIGVIAVSNNQTLRWYGHGWTVAQSTGPVPPASASFAFDAARRRVVAFGGAVGAVQSATTWEWDGVNWMQRAPALSPPGRSGHAMAYHTGSQRVVLFGGNTSGGLAGDTWTWDGITWTQEFPANLPPARSTPVFVDLPHEHLAVLQGGTGSSGDLDDTWTWDGADWQRQVPAGPTHSGSDAAAFAFDNGSQTSLVVWENPSASFPAQVQTFTATTMYEEYRLSCAGHCGSLRLSALSLPRVGSTFTLRIDGICPSTDPDHTGFSGVLFFTLDDHWLFQDPNWPLPFGLSVIGAPGCFINVDTAHRNATIMPFVEQAGLHEKSIGIGLPNLQVLLGFEFYSRRPIDPICESLPRSRH
ncbi:MAG: C-type lectin domain-containing protein [Planctomycetota bacterium]